MHNQLMYFSILRFIISKVNKTKQDCHSGCRIHINVRMLQCKPYLLASPKKKLHLDWRIWWKARSKTRQPVIVLLSHVDFLQKNRHNVKMLKSTKEQIFRKWQLNVWNILYIICSIQCVYFMYAIVQLCILLNFRLIATCILVSLLHTFSLIRVQCSVLCFISSYIVFSERWSFHVKNKLRPSFYRELPSDTMPKVFWINIESPEWAFLADKVDYQKQSKSSHKRKT